MRKIILLLAGFLVVGLAFGQTQPQRGTSAKKAMKAISLQKAGVTVEKGTCDRNDLTDEQIREFKSREEPTRCVKAPPYQPKEGKGVILDEGFEGTWPPSGWGFFELADPGGWESSTNAYTGTQAAMHEDLYGTSSEDWMVSPALTIDNANYELNFWEYQNYGSYYVLHKVSVLDGADPSTANELEVLYSAVGIEDSWAEQTFSLAAYNGQTIYIGFYYEGNYADEWTIDDVVVSYPAANDAGISAINTPINGGTIGNKTVNATIENFGTADLTQATIQWQVDGVIQSPVSYTNAAGLALGATEDVDLGTFNFATEATYEIKAWTEMPNGVADEDNTNDSTTVNVDLVAPIIPPYAEDFENGGTIPDFWINDSNDDADWEFVTSMGHGASGDHTTGTGYFAGIDDSSPNDDGDEMILVSPPFDLANSGMTMPTLKFWYMNTDAAAEPQSQLYVEAWDGSTWVELGLIDYAIEEWTEFTFDLTPYVGQDEFKFRFRALTTSSYYSDPSLDDVSITEPPALDAALTDLIQPKSNFYPGKDLDIEIELTNKGVNNLTSADIVWDVVEQTGMTSIASGTYNWTGDLAFEESEMVTAATFTSIDDTLLLEVYVENPNGGTDEENSNDTIIMEITPAMVLSTFPHTDSLENAGMIPDGWYNDPNDGGIDWQFVNGYVGTGTHGAGQDHTSGTGYFAGLDDSDTDEGAMYNLITPYYDLASSSLSLPILKFWYQNIENGGSASAYSPLHIDVWNGTAWDEDILVITEKYDVWTEFIVDISAYASQDDVQIRFRGEGIADFYSDLSLDDVTITEPAALDAALVDIMQPTTQFYPGKDLDIEVELLNNGSTNLTSADIVWNVVENTNMTSIASGTYSWSGDLAFNTSEAVNIGPFTSINDTLMVEVYVDNPNGGTDELADNDTVSVEILPAAVVASFPDTVDFENGGDIPLGWFNNQDDNGDWTFVASMGHGASGDHTTGSGYFAGVDDSSPNDEGDELILTSPYLDLANSGLVLPLLKFWYMNTDDATAPQSQLYVEGWDGTQWFEIDVIDYAIEAWTEFEYNLVDYVSQDDFKIRFRAVTTSDFYSDPSLDDIMIYQPEPEDAAVNEITYPDINPISSDDWAIRAEIMNNGYNNLTSLTLNWETDDGSGPVVQTPYSWTGDLAYGESEIVEIVPDFTFNTGSYDVTVYSEAPNGQTDPNNDNDTAFASYDVIGAGQVVEDFEGSTFLPVGWSETNNASAWMHSAPGDWYTLNGQSAALFQDLNSPEEKLIMPKMSVDGNDSLVFYIRGGNGTFGFGYSQVVLKYTADTTGGGTWTNVGDTINLDFDAGTRYVRDLSAIPAGDYFFAFSSTSTFDYSGYNSATVVDDIMGPVKAGIANNDLSVEEVTYTSDFKTPGEVVAINAKIKNVGLDAQTGVVAKLSVDGTVQNDSIILPTLHYNEPANISFDWTAEAGIHEFEVFIEADENTTNDSYTVQDAVPMAGQIAEGFEGSLSFPYKWQAPAAEWGIGENFFIGTYENTNIAYAYSAGSDGEILVTPTVEISDAVTDDISFYAAGGNLSVGEVKLQMLLMAEGDTTWQKVGDTLNIDHDYFEFYSFNLDTAAEGRYNIGFSFSGVTDGTYGSALGIDHVVGPYIIDSVDFVVTDSAMMPLANAMIEVDGQQLYTDSSGMAEYTTIYGMYDYTVTKAGYEVYNDTLELTGDMVESIILMPTNPMAIDVVPDSNEVNVGVQPTITCEFDQPVSENDFTGITLEEIGVGTVAGISSEVLPDGFTVKITTPQLSWAGDYTVSIPSNTVINDYGMSNEPVTWSFETRDVSTPIPAAYSPDAGATDLLLPIGDITCQFDQNVSPTTTGALDNVTLEDDDGNQITGLTTTLVNDNTVSIQHPALSYNTMYTVSIPSNTVTNGYIVNDPVSWNFTTRMTTQPLVENLTPADGATNIAIPTDIMCEFDQTVSPTTANSLDNITVSEGGTPLTGVSATINDSIVSIAHPTLTHNTTYTVTIPSGTVSNVYGTFYNTETVWTFTTEPIFTVTFVVTDNATTDPIAGAEVDIDGNILTTDASGEATIDLVNGTYTYDVTATNYDPVSSSVTVSGAPVTEAVGMDETQYTVTFVVTDNATTDPIVGAEVDIDGNILTTDASGEATIDLINGTYTYDVTATNYDPVSGDVTVSSAPVTENVGMDETQYTVTFVVTDNATTDPIAGAEIDVDGNILTTDGNGEATIDLINGTYTYDVTATGYDPVSGDVTVSSAPVTEDVGMDETQYTVTFVVTDNVTTDPIVGAEVDIDGNLLTTDANGEATIDLINGDYDYTVTSTGYDAATGTVTVSSAAVTEEVGLDPSTYTVTFAVSNAENSEPVIGAEISVDGEILTTDNNGEATIDLANGNYDYTVTADDYLDATGTVVVDGAAVTEAVELDPDGIADLEKAGIKVYPNPTNGEFNISVDTRYQLSVIDMTGKVVYGQDLQDDVNEVDISSLPSGMYIIELRNSETIHTLRILKK